MNTEKVQLFVNKLTRPELSALNKMVVDRIKNQDRETGALESLKYNVGQIVEFRTRKGWWAKAEVLRVNQQTLTVRLSSPPYTQWRVPYCYIRAVKS